MLMHLVKHWGIMSVTVQEAIEAEEINGKSMEVQVGVDYVDGELPTRSRRTSRS